MAEEKGRSERQEYWNQMVEWYLKHVAASTAKLYKCILPFFRLNEVQTLVEAACGPGNGIDVYLPHLPPTARVLACDLAPRFIEHVVSRNLPRVEAVVADSEALPYEDASADRYISSLSLLHVPHPDRMAREAVRILKPGGVAAFTLWTERSESPLMDILHTLRAKFIDEPQKEVFCLGNPQVLKTLLLEAGFSRVLTFREYVQFPYTEQADIEQAFKDHPKISQLLNSPRGEEAAQELSRLVRELIVDKGKPLDSLGLVALAFK